MQKFVRNPEPVYAVQHTVGHSAMEILGELEKDNVPVSHGTGIRVSSHVPDVLIVYRRGVNNYCLLTNWVVWIRGDFYVFSDEDFHAIYTEVK